MNIAQYLAEEVARGERAVRIRALLPQDRQAMLDAVGRLDSAALYTRFFSPKQHFSEREIDYFVNVDFVKHVALVAEVNEGGTPLIAGGARYVVTQPGTAEMAFAVDDAHRGMGIGKLLMRHLARIAAAAGLHTLCAEVLAENSAMLAVFKGCGLPFQLQRDGGVTLVRISVAPAS